ncbi:type II toxin-antitoxin system Phd/YefM family antitoxin [Vibrio parahaemolyticus]|uniref:type II toxin-antitoxin system Phd/YefM family antitoxin n=1 Tax=Vibrio furnissii TaxID=29494 RepID=UPI0012EBED38|nr:type II toxin-antitoxin system Phd/YefM family antitoxin [Vibrio furnissii]EHZ2727045.1 type II toxin-antitoxin system Phd/YefM family antitoxin [Vibrio parahaemolyticus]MVC39939.1 type II toxin-antitoxin system Phd/YefM family antitoxin [Vibrio cholerae]EIV1599695.1 type II toxin-antitoxin system Phd/YefM family antitoxin [Vibrio parahaemolyticus]MCG6268616.1 type II toxin-antitoxin system Phd/YefM family antitoxin [Vibrio furnissii]HCE4999450.1 type II toxin-antitoxin system Phd/YefM fami
MQTMTANQAKTNFGELILSAQREPVKITRNNKEACVVLSMKDYEALEKLKLDYIKQCFIDGEKDYQNGDCVDGEEFMKNL